jgi:hypothetical protein
MGGFDASVCSPAEKERKEKEKEKKKNRVVFYGNVIDAASL